MAGAFADAAINDGVGLRTDAATLHVNLLQFGCWFEGAVIIHCSLPRHAFRARNMTAAEYAFLWILRHVRDLALVLTRGTDIDQRFARFTLRQSFVRESANFLIVTSLRHRIICARIFRCLSRHLPAFCLPFVAAAVENLHLIMAEQSKSPESVARPPIRFVAIENTGRFGRDAIAAAQLGEFVWLNVIANNRILQVRSPIDV